MDMKQAIAPVAAKSQAPEKFDKAKDVTEGQTSAPAFSQLLHGLQSGEPMAAGGDVIGTAFGTQDIALPLNQDAALLSDALQSLPLGMSLESLVGQTQQLDKVDADVALQDGSFLQAKQDAGLLSVADGLIAGAQPHVAVGQRIATVAAGVESVVASPVQTGVSTAVAVASAALAEAADLAGAVAQAVSDGLSSDADTEGRVALHGAWKLEDPQAPVNPALQRLMGQVEQWAAASAGVQPKVVERGEGAKSAANTAEWLAAGQGSGTRLTEAAVQETQSAQDAMLESQTDAPVEDMRFWLQGKQQRAEVVLEKDGQPVRVQVSVRGNEAHVTFRADQAQTRELLDASLTQLREMLEQQGVQLAGVSVQADAQGNGGQASQQGGARNPWDSSKAQHAQVAVPLASEAPAARSHRAQGLDLYA